MSTIDQRSTIERLIAAHAHSAPDRTAVTSVDGSLTYGKLLNRALVTSRRLRAAGVQPGSIVGLAAARSVDATAGLLGILLADCAYLYLDPQHPLTRQALMAHECQLSFALVDDLQQWQLPDVTPIALSGELADGKHEADHEDGHHNELCYVCFTSGSTGEPKGVLVEQRGVVNMALGLRSVFGIHADSRVLQFASWNFDAAACEIFVALSAGATLCLAPDYTLTAGPRLAEYLREQKITFATLTPSVLDALSPDDLPDLAAIAAVGEPCPEDLLARWARGRRFFNGYGPTEVTVAATVGELHPGEEIHIGHAVPGAEIRLVDPDNGRVVTAGEVGELQVSGAGLARGYLNHPFLTEKKFVTDEIYPEKRWYRTGDMARQRPDGNFVFVGRIDNQVKIRGLRIELEEVEAALRRHRLVKQCAVVALDTRLVAYIVPVDETLTTDVVAEFVRQWLPAYMVPNQIVLTAELPLNAWGKVDRLALPHYIEGHEPTELSAHVLAILRRAMESATLTVDDNIFDHGGHSLLAAQVSVELKSAFGIELPVLAVFDNPTPRQLAAIIGQQQASREGDPHASLA